ncbi:Holliday junction branch migration protein RuvA [Alteromonas sediminis]|uniref:Holliday junction branch migration complex subunit RuvA n=1 Tax=Alteromonas sediminis TaxID=2259342 RepID=A0A3N5Y3M9_9ALTE|nr:Holliday junction branch migration protein RuvA [Alteromonas sediminis]RPJ68552.1 Holliday junction branch migration protein RuvA [Alteromonas sediminis]
MIGRIHGTLIEKSPPDVLIDVNGVGYEVQIPMTCFYELPEQGESITLYTHFVVREDAQLLFGFTDKMARELFRELIKANGVGPKLGLTILSGMSASHVLSSVQNEDISALVSLPGVGKKTAERLVVELKDRLAKFAKKAELPALPIDGQVSSYAEVPVNAEDEAVDALVSLGYKPAQATKMVKSVAQSGMTSELIIRDALKAAI